MMKNFFLLGILAVFGFSALSLATVLIEGENSFTLPGTCPQNGGEYYDKATTKSLQSELASLDKTKITTLQIAPDEILFFDNEPIRITIEGNLIPTGLTLQDMTDRIENTSTFFHFSDTTKLTLLLGQGLPGKVGHLQFEDTPYGESWRKCCGNNTLFDKKAAKAAFEELTWITPTFKEHMERTYPFLAEKRSKILLPPQTNILRSILKNTGAPNNFLDR